MKNILDTKSSATASRSKSNFYTLGIFFTLAFSLVFSVELGLENLKMQALAVQTETTKANLSNTELAAIREQMLKFRDVSAELIPFAFSEKTSPAVNAQQVNQTNKETEQILSLLTRLNESMNASKAISKDGHSELFATNPMARVTYKIMTKNVEESLVNFRKNRPELAKDFLKASFHACLTCHASGLSKTSFSSEFLTQIEGQQGEKTFSERLSALNKGEMYYVLRDFEKTKKVLTEFISHSLEDQAQSSTTLTQNKSKPSTRLPDDSEISRAMELYISASIVQETPTAQLEEVVTNWLKNKNLSPELKVTLSEWKSSLQYWTKTGIQLEKLIQTSSNSTQPHSSPASPSNLSAPSTGQEDSEPFKVIEQAIGLAINDTLLGNEKTLIDHLYAKVFLIQLASRVDTLASDRARALHDLGLIYRANEKVLFLGLGDAYFEECIHLVERSPQAFKCYQSLRASIEEASSGSAGTHLDAEDTALLKKLEKKAKPASIP